MMFFFHSFLFVSHSALRDKLFRKVKHVTDAKEEIIDDASCLTDDIIEDILGMYLIVFLLKHGLDYTTKCVSNSERLFRNKIAKS